MTLLEMKKKVLGLIEELNAESEGYVVDVYKKHIVLRGRDFVKGEFLPIATYRIISILAHLAQAITLLYRIHRLNNLRRKVKNETNN